MESLVPSEIARLVYGYLIEEKCEAAAQQFLETSPCLKECLDYKKKGRKFSTSVCGLSLVDILNLYTDAVCLVKNYIARKDSLNQSLSDFVRELGNILVLDHESGRSISKTVFLRISVPSKKSAHKNSSHLEDNGEDSENQKENKKNNENEPKKSQIEEPPSLKNNPVTNADDFDLNMLQTLLDNTTLHERLAENINKAMDSSGEVSKEKIEDRKIIDTILHSTEADPVFNELLHDLVVPRAEATTTPEDTDKENGDPSVNRQSKTGITNEDEETTKRFLEETNLAVEGILAGNKKLQLEKDVPKEVTSPEAIVISTPQFVETSSGVYKQSYIIPQYAYTVADIIPASQIQNLSSSPLQPLKVTNLATFGNLSPIFPQQSSSSKASTCIRNNIPRRRRCILPKSESFVIQVPSQDDDRIQEVKVDIPANPKGMPEVFKRSSVRTRGGLQKIGKRGVKAISPQITSSVDKNIEIVVAPTNLKKINTSGIKTRSMLKKQDKNKKGPSIDLLSLSDDVAVQGQTETVQGATETAQGVTETVQGATETPQGATETAQGATEIAQGQTETIQEPTQVAQGQTETTQGQTESVEGQTAKESHFQLEEPKDIDPTSVKSKGKEDVNKEEETEGTPEQQNPVKKPRVSLSTPRRTHVRVLDFTTPTKDLVLKRSLTSPKVYHHKKNDAKGIEGLKRGMFNTPLKKTSKDIEKVEKNCKSKKDWDSDLRMFMSASDGMDIPTSVGLKRKNFPKKDKAVNNKKKIGKNKLAKKVLDQKKSNEDDLVKQIEKEVMDVIDEEEMVLNTSHNSETTDNLIEQKLVEEMDKDDSFTFKKRQGIRDIQSVVRNIDHVISSEKKPIEDPVSQTNRDEGHNIEPNCNEKGSSSNDETEQLDVPAEFNSSTPLKLTMSPINENSRGQLTPTTKIVLSHLGKNSSGFPSLYSPTSQGSLENILIKECSRMETEKNSSDQDVSKISSKPDITSCNEINTCNIPPNSDSKNTESNNPSISNKTNLEPVEKNNVNIFQTPAKFLGASIPPGTPVEMTPLTKVLTSLTNISNTVLVTPTIPPTPKNPSSLVTPQKNESPVSSENIFENQHEHILPAVSDIEGEETSNTEKLEDFSVDLNKDICGTQSSITKSIKGSSAILKGNDKKIIENKLLTEKKLSKTPKIKLMSPKLNKTNLNQTSTDKKVPTMPSKTTEKILANNVEEGSNEVHDEKELESDAFSEKPSVSEKNIKTSERMPLKKRIAKQLKIETKKQSTLRRKKQIFPTTASKSVKKTTKNCDSAIDNDEIESEIRHLLKDTKAKLFGPDNSSDSDSDASCIEIKKVQLVKSARERLQKLENIKMLNSSSTSDESSDEESLKPKLLERDSILKDDSLEKTKSSLGEHINSSLESNYVTKAHSDSGSIKKSEGCSNKLFDHTKTVLKDIEESCESFPTLHLSEESNQSLRSDHLIKYPKARKSPLIGSDSVKKTSSLLQVASPLKTEQSMGTIAGDFKSRDQPVGSNYSCSNKSEPNVHTKPVEDQEMHTDEQIFHFIDMSENFKPKLSDSAEKLNRAKSQAVSEFLDDYVYSFTLNMDKSGNLLRKNLRTSSFLNIFDLSKSEHKSAPEHFKKELSRSMKNEYRSSNRDSSRIDHRSHSRRKNESRKRHRDALSSDEDCDKKDYGRRYGYYKDGRERGYRRYSKTDTYDRRDLFSRYSSRHNRHRDHGHFSPYDKRRSRHVSPDSRRLSKREDRRPLEEKLQLSKYDGKSHSYDNRHNSFNDSFTSSKSGSEPDGKLIEINSTYSSDRLMESRRERCSSSSQRLSIIVDDSPFYSRSKSQRTSKLHKIQEREDGELSDSSEVKIRSSESNRSPAASMGANDSRATLLKKVDLDHFLSIVHGNEK